MPVATVRTPQTHAYREVYAHLFDLEPGALVGTTEIMDSLAQLPQFTTPIAHKTVWNALARAEEVRLVERRNVRRVRGKPVLRWARLEWPEPVTLEWLRRRGAPLAVAANVLDALEACGWLAVSDEGYRRVR